MNVPVEKFGFHIVCDRCGNANCQLNMKTDENIFIVFCEKCNIGVVREFFDKENDKGVLNGKR